MTEELKPIDVSKYTFTENGNVIRTDNKETLKNALARIEELEKENIHLKHMIEEGYKAGNGEFWRTVWDCIKGYEELEKENAKAKEIIKGILPYTTFTLDKETNSYLIKYYEQAEDFIKE